jgi:LysM repeat protein
MMTRETKIGLLVGLAFILVVGILLSEHITGSNERPAAPLADAGHGVRNGVSAPGAAAEEPMKIAEPTAPVPSPADLTPKPPVSQVAVVPPQPTPGNTTNVIVAPAQPVGPVAVIPAPQAVVPVPQPTSPQAEPATVIIRNPTDPFANNPIAKIAREMGEQVVPVGGKTTPKEAATPKLVANTTTAREYKAKAGDTLSRIASQLPGGNTKTNRDAVVAMNPTLQKDPNHVVSGRTYLLPADVSAAPIAPKPLAVAEATAPKVVTPVVADKTKEAKVIETKADPKADNASRIYVVKPGDTLSKIASAELGSKNEVATIRKLNPDLLKSGDKILVDMKLKLPAKLVASASIR